MKKILILIPLLLLVSCGMTQEEKLDAVNNCKELWLDYHLTDMNNISCMRYWQNKTMECIREYTNWLDEKYNNPDHVTNLREDDYSEVVKTCNEIFWNNN